MNDKVLLVDLNSIPTKHGFTFDNWLDILKTHGIMFYDSTSGKKPMSTQKLSGIKAIDINSQEIKDILKEIK